LVDLEPITASPEILGARWMELGETAFAPAPSSLPPFERILASLGRGRPDALLLLDEITELRALSYFPGVSRPFEAILKALSSAGAPATIATTRFPTWIRSFLGDITPRERECMALVEIPPLAGPEIPELDPETAEQLVEASGGLPLHAAPLLERLGRGGTLKEALAAEIGDGGLVEAECRATLGKLLLLARGYGACKAVLLTLAGEEGLTLSEVARRIERTPGSTRDYLLWLEEVELVRSREKRFYFVDPVLRLWMRLYAQGRPPSERQIAEELEMYFGLGGGVPAQEAPAVETPSAVEDLIQID
jgi:hypothetical protein